MSAALKNVNFKAAALAYASRFGWAVFPVHSIRDKHCTCGDNDCKRPGKHPVSSLAPHGLKDASKDPDVIKRWWSAMPYANIGVATGEVSGFFALDVDPDKYGDDSLFDLRERCKPWPDTVQQITGSGGWHYLFKHPGRQIKNSVEDLGPGLDVRGDGGYIVVPPSEHIRGRRYEWEGDSRPENVSIKEAPPYLLSKVLKRTYKQKIPDEAIPEERLTKEEIQRIRFALYYINPENRDTWLQVGMALHAKSNSNQTYALWSEWSQQSDKFDSRDQFKTWQSFKPDGGITLGTLFNLARAGGWTPVEGVQIKEEQPAAAVLWEDALYRNRFGGVIPSLGNLETILLHSEHWAGLLAFDAFSLRVLKRRAPPWTGGEPGEWSDSDDTRTCIWLERNFFSRWAPEAVRRTVTIVAERTAFHPVREYLESLAWDGKPRAATWLSRYMGAEDTPYHRLIGRSWLIGACARIFQPGCQMDNVLILEGRQGIGKSTALNILSSPWYDDTAIDLSSRDIYLAMRGRWIIELGELDSLNRAEVSRAKQFFTVKEDNYRPPYGRSIISVPRQCVFAGTVNQSAYLRDDENRRYWPVLCGTVARDRLRKDRDQLWGEALTLYRQQEPWWTDGTLDYVQEAQESRMTTDPWDDRVTEFLFGKEQTTMREILEDALLLKAAQQDRTAEIRVGHILKRLGWRRIRARVFGVLKWVYAAPAGGVPIP